MAKRKTLIENAKKYLGVPYVWGGDSFDPNHPNRHCSTRFGEKEKEINIHERIHCENGG